MLDDLCSEMNLADLCYREGVAESVYYRWSKDFLEAGKKRLAVDTAIAANTDEVTVLRQEYRDLMEVIVSQTFELRLLKKRAIKGGGDGK